MGLSDVQKKERSEYLEKHLTITECSQRKPYVFVSYASDNWETVFQTAVVPMQKKYGLSVYADKAFDKVNDKWIVPMLRNIRGADVVVAFVSQSYIESYACFLELLTAVNNRKQIVFVSLEDRLHLGDTTDQPDVERGVKNEILNQGANIATNTNNSSNDTMRAMKSAYTSISTLLEQDALSKYDISDAFINFFRDASVNRKTINDLNAVRGTIWSVSEAVFDKALIEEPAPVPVQQAEPVIPQPTELAQPQQAESAQPQQAESAGLQQAESTESQQAESEDPQQAESAQSQQTESAELQQAESVQSQPQYVPQPDQNDHADFTWGNRQSEIREAKPLKSIKRGIGSILSKVLMGIGAVVVLLIVIGVLAGGKTVENEPYVMASGNSLEISGAYTGDWDKKNKWPSGKGTFVLDGGAGTFEGEWVDGVIEGQGTAKWPNGTFMEVRFEKGALYVTDQEYTAPVEDATSAKSSGSYTGFWDMSKQQPQGQGTMKYDGGYGYVYEGEWKNGVREGQGVLTWVNEKGSNKYEGAFANNRKKGQGKEIYASGDAYEGEFADDLREGYGVYTWASGAKYEGGWKANKRDGDGVYTGTDGKKTNEKWSNGAKFVVDMEYNSGTYTGFWDTTNKRPQGEGILKDKNGNIYEGTFADGKKNGTGKMTYASGNVYDGGWKDDKRHGKCIYKFANGDVYDGEYTDDKFTGKGIYTWANGDKYEGEFENNKRNGKGIYTWANGDKYKYEGEYADDKNNGKGKMTYADGSVYEGVWQDGNKHGDGVYTAPDGKKTNQKWENGKQIT